MNDLNDEMLVVNLDKKLIMDPRNFTLSKGNTLFEISFIHPRWGNPFQYEFFNLLKEKWKGDRIALFHDTDEAREYLTEQEGFRFFHSIKKLNRVVRKEKGVQRITVTPKEAERLTKRWSEFVNQYVLINYDMHLFMTIDKRLFKRTKDIMPYFPLGVAEEDMADSCWAGSRLGIEPIGTDTLNQDMYFEMFRMIGDKSACQLGVEEYHRRLSGIK